MSDAILRMNTNTTCKIRSRQLESNIYTIYIHTTLTMFTVLQPSSNSIAKDIRNTTATGLSDMTEYKQYCLILNNLKLNSLGI